MHSLVIVVIIIIICVTRSFYTQKNDVPFVKQIFNVWNESVLINMSH